MNPFRLLPILALCSFVRTAVAQDTAIFEIRLESDSNTLHLAPAVFDTILLRKTFNEPLKTYTNVVTEGGVFRLPQVPAGKYWLSFVSRTAVVSPLRVTVCSRCSNAFAFTSYPATEYRSNVVFQSIEVSPGYFGDARKLAKDFTGRLSKMERKLIRQSDEFTVHFFVTKQGVVSDATFSPAGLPAGVQEAVRKGLQQLTDWRPAMQNGREVDDEMSLQKSQLTGGK